MLFYDFKLFCLGKGGDIVPQSTGMYGFGLVPLTKLFLSNVHLCWSYSLIYLSMPRNEVKRGSNCVHF